MKSWYLYIAQARTGRFYTGITVDTQARLDMHNSGKGSRFAVQQGPFVLVYVSQSLESSIEARKLEITVKSWSQKKKKMLINGEWSLL